MKKIHFVVSSTKAQTILRFGGGGGDDRGGGAPTAN